MSYKIGDTVRVVIIDVHHLNTALSVLARYVDRKLRLAFSESKIFIPLRETPPSSVLEFLRHKLDAEFTWMAPNIFPRKTRSLSLKALEKRVGLPVPKSVSIVGDILLINELPENAEGLEYEIGKLLLQNFGVRAVFLKTRKVSGVERVPTWQKLAGWGDTFTVHRENACWFALDISKVFFNPRLSNERLRVSKLVRDNEVVVDMFAGVGPFAILIKKASGATVYAIDINRHAVEFMKLNSKLNKVEINVLEGDARLKVMEVKKPATRVIMNYPEGSINFIEAALKVLGGSGVIHLYVFCDDNKLDKLRSEVIDRIQKMGSCVENMLTRIVSEVAPRRYLYCLDIALQKLNY